MTAAAPLLAAHDVAKALVLADEARRPPDERLFADPTAEIFTAGREQDPAVAERLVRAPFFRERVRLRARFFDDCVWAGLGIGLMQVVSVGAGCDGRSFRLHGLAACGARLFEVDAPGLLAEKVVRLEAAGLDLPRFVSLVPAEADATVVSPELARALGEAGFRKGAGSLFLVEGAAGLAAAERLDDEPLRALAALAGTPARLLFDFHVGRVSPRLVLATLAAAGFRDAETHSFAELHRAYLPGEPAMGAELFHVADAQC